MNVFVLCTGRCGSTTFIAACNHITNYSAAHESRTRLIGDERLKYPVNHIEADNRLSWLLGRLEELYGDNAFYVHLRRNKLDTARSFSKRYDSGIIRAYRSDILMGGPQDTDPMNICMDYCDTVNRNIHVFLKDKTRKITFSMETAKEDFEKFWDLVGAEGDLTAALSELDKSYNASDRNQRYELKRNAERSFAARLVHKGNNGRDRNTAGKSITERVQESSAFSKANSKAGEYANDPNKLNALIDKALKKAGSIQTGLFSEFRDSLSACFRLLRAYTRREYTKISLQSLLLIIASIAYFVMTFDLIPDFIIGLGYLDDAALLAWTMKAVKSDMDNFRMWEAGRG